MRRALILLAVACSWAVPAHAQLSPGTSGFSSAPTEASQAEYWVMIRTLGACLADYKTDKAQAFLTTAPGSSAEDAAFSALFENRRHRCMGNFVSATMLRSHVRGSVAEGLFEQMGEAAQAAIAMRQLAAPAQIASLHDFADCYVASHAANAAAFLDQTKLGSKGEIAALQQMAPDFAPCLPADREVRLDPIDLRMAIAEGLYHAANGSGASGELGSP